MFSENCYILESIPTLMELFSRSQHTRPIPYISLSNDRNCGFISGVVKRKTVRGGFSNLIEINPPSETLSEKARFLTANDTNRLIYAIIAEFL